MLNGMLSKRHRLTRVTALASLQGLNVRALLRGRGQRMRSQPPKLRDQLAAAGTATPKCHICIAVTMNGVQTEAPQLPRHADFLLCKLEECDDNAAGDGKWDICHLGLTHTDAGLSLCCCNSSYSMC